MALDHFRTTCQKVWTAVFACTWILLLIGTITWVVAVVQLVPPLADLPDNLVKGFDVVFGFALLQADSDSIKLASTTALAKCGVIPSNCPSNYPYNSATVDTNIEKATVSAAFQSSLAKVQKVTNDIYFGVPDFQSTATELNNILANFNNIDANGMPCAGASPLYCSMYSSAGVIVDGIGQVNAQINSFTKSDIVSDWKDASDYLYGLAVFPLLLIIAALCFCGVWYRDGTCICCADGTKCGCAMTCCHAFWWLIFFVLVTVIAAISVVAKYGQNRVKLDMLNHDPSVKDFLNHVQTSFPEFWNMVFADMEEALLNIFRSSVTMWVFCVVIVFYGVCMCCWRPYSQGAEYKVASEAESERNVLKS
mmetsp:Transcript_84959/g.132776  ORF Transcript_84959/g.132776 Transcript_84959/m.132776 type:complete len:365 (+) Transcript_84959:72-1166(+)